MNLPAESVSKSTLADASWEIIFFPSRKAFSAVLWSFISEEILSSSDVTDALAASTCTSLGADIVVLNKQSALCVITHTSTKQTYLQFWATEEQTDLCVTHTITMPIPADKNALPEA